MQGTCALFPCVRQSTSTMSLVSMRYTKYMEILKSFVLCMQARHMEIPMYLDLRMETRYMEIFTYLI